MSTKEILKIAGSGSIRVPVYATERGGGLDELATKFLLSSISGGLLGYGGYKLGAKIGHHLKNRALRKLKLKSVKDATNEQRLKMAKRMYISQSAGLLGGTAGGALLGRNFGESIHKKARTYSDEEKALAYDKVRSRLKAANYIAGPLLGAGLGGAIVHQAVKPYEFLSRYPSVSTFAGSNKRKALIGLGAAVGGWLGFKDAVKSEKRSRKILEGHVRKGNYDRPSARKLINKYTHSSLKQAAIRAPALTEAKDKARAFDASVISLTGGGSAIGTIGGGLLGHRLGKGMGGLGELVGMTLGGYLGHLPGKYYHKHLLNKASKEYKKKFKLTK